MKIVLYNNRRSLPEAPGDHIFIYTGLSDPVDGELPETVTEIHCTYSIGEQTVSFSKNTEPQTLRFEDAVVWAVRYAKSVNITAIHAVFQLSRSIDPKLLTRIGGVQLVDERRTPQFGGGIATCAPLTIGAPTAAARAYLPKTALQRRSIGGVKRRGYNTARRARGARPGI